MRNKIISMGKAIETDHGSVPVSTAEHYPGVDLTDTLSPTRAFHDQLSKAKTAWNKLNTMFTRAQLYTYLKLPLYKTRVGAVLTYGPAAVATRAKEMDKKEAFQMNPEDYTWIMASDNAKRGYL